MTDTATKTHIFYTDASNGWCEMHIDDQEFQVGECFYHYRKSDAIKSARSMNIPVHIFGKNGLFQRIA